MTQKKVTPKHQPALTGAAADLILAAQAGPPCMAMPPQAQAELKKVCEYNDHAPIKSRVSFESTVEMLQSLGWAGTSRTALNHACRKFLGRSSFGSA